MSEVKNVTFDSTILMVLLTLVLVAGKTIGGWEISWLWALSPMWLPYAFIIGFLGIIIVVLIVVFIVALVAMLLGYGK